MNKSTLDGVSNGKRSEKTDPEGHGVQLYSKVTGIEQEQSANFGQVETGAYGNDGAKVEENLHSRPPFPFAGIIMALFSSLLFSISMTCVKLLPDSQGFEEKMKIAAFRGSQMILYCSISAIWNKSSLLVDRTELWLVLARSLLGTIGTFGTFCSLKYITPGESTALVFCSLIWTSLLSYIVFKEPLRWIYLIALPGCLLGITLIADPILLGLNFDYQQSDKAIIELDYVSSDDYNSTTAAIERRLPGIIMALIVSLSLSFSFIVLKIRRSTTVNTTTFWFGVSILLSSLIAMTLIGFGRLPDTWREWILLLTMGVTSYGAQVFLQRSFDFESPSVLAIVSTAEIVFTFAVGAIVLEQTTYWTSFAGASLILLVVLIIMLSNWFNAKASVEDEQQQQGKQADGGTEVQVKVD